MDVQAAVPCLFGPTGVGKSAVALAVARRTRGEVIACDAFSVYRGLEILSAAPAAAPDVPHHLVGILAPSETFSAARFVVEADRIVADVHRHGRTPWIVGGTALYLRAWLKGFGAPVGRDPALRARLEAEADTLGPAALHARLARVDPARAADLHPHDVRRVVRALEILEATGVRASRQLGQWKGPDRKAAVLIGLRRTTEDLAARIERRTHAMFESGVLEEVQRVRTLAASPEAAKALGFDLVCEVLDGRRDVPSARGELALRTRRFARKQMTFFRSFEHVAWIDVEAREAPEETATRVLAEVPAAALAPRPPGPPAP